MLMLAVKHTGHMYGVEHRLTNETLPGVYQICGNYVSSCLKNSGCVQDLIKSSLLKTLPKSEMETKQNTLAVHLCKPPMASKASQLGILGNAPNPI